MQRWCLEIKLNNEDIEAIDGDIDIRITDDSLNGPFKLYDFQEDSEISRIHEIISWIQRKSFKTKKGIFVAIIENEEQMLAFVEVSSSRIQVNGFLASPIINTNLHNTAQSMLILELIDMAYNSDSNIIFLFS
tara:strand:+ start:220 stop:618 length:399 start_codon:yes stop_codon:yes gene_type:complete